MHDTSIPTCQLKKINYFNSIEVNSNCGTKLLQSCDFEDVWKILSSSKDCNNNLVKSIGSNSILRT